MKIVSKIGSVFLAALISLPIVPKLASAQSGKASGDVQARARADFDRGQELAKKKRYAEAMDAFSSGYEASKKPLFLFNMAEMARQLGQVDRARALYERYLVEDPSGKLAAETRERLASLPPSKLETKPGAEPVAGGPATPPPGDRATAPGTGAKDPKATGTPATLPPPSAVAAEAERPAGPAATSLHARSDSGGRPIWKRWPFWAGVGAAVVVGTVVAFSLSSDGGCGSSCVEINFRD